MAPARYRRCRRKRCYRDRPRPHRAVSVDRACCRRRSIKHRKTAGGKAEAFRTAECKTDRARRREKDTRVCLGAVGQIRQCIGASAVVFRCHFYGSISGSVYAHLCRIRSQRCYLRVSAAYGSITVVHVVVTAAARFRAQVIPAIAIVEHRFGAGSQNPAIRSCLNKIR